MESRSSLGSKVKVREEESVCELVFLMGLQKLLGHRLVGWSWRLEVE